VEKSQQGLAVAEAREQFENPKERKRPPLEAVTRRLVKTATQEIYCHVEKVCLLDRTAVK
jgi:hypothetical protein